MGCGSFTSSSWDSYKASSGINHARSASDIFKTKATSIDKSWLPFNVTRESCDSDEHPESTPIIIGLDVTASMSRVLEVAAKRVGDTMLEIMDRKCVTDPQILYAAIDDYITSEERCLQITQFESDIRIAEQMHNLSFIERGGGNNWESYADLWYFARYHTKCDAFDKGRKGIIFTIGDDGIQDTISAREISDIFGDTLEGSVNVKTLLSELNRNWEVYHLNIRGGSCSSHVLNQWKSYLGNHSIEVDDVDSIPEIIVSILQTLRGDSVDTIVSSWSGSTAVAVKSAISALAVPTAGTSNDVVVF